MKYEVINHGILIMDIKLISYHVCEYLDLIIIEFRIGSV